MSATPTAAVEVVTIGDELLLGETVDRNAAWLGQVFSGAGIRVNRRSTVGDEVAVIRDTLAAALERTGVVVCTGGLGPTPDDLTRNAVAELLRRPLVVDPAVLGRIEARFTARGLQMPERNRTQAEVPAGATVLPNELGTAPGLAIDAGEDRLVILLPGVPSEMRALVEQQVLPLLRKRWPDLDRPIRHRILRTTGIAESSLAETIDDLLAGLSPLTLAFLPSTGGVDLRLTSWSAFDAPLAEAALEAAEVLLRERLGSFVYGSGREDLASMLGRELTRRGVRLAVAESCTGGLLAKRLTDPPGASSFLVGGVVAYADEVKQLALGVTSDALDRHGAVSEAVVRQMAGGVRQRMDARAALAITGIAGPGGATAEKPVGTVWIAAALDDQIVARLFRFGGGRDEIRERAAQAALSMLWNLLRESDPA